MDDKELEDAIRDCFERHKIPPEQQKAIFDWADQLEIRMALLTNVKEGAMDICGIKNGDPLFKLTEQGAEYARKIFKEHDGDGDGKA